MEIADYRELTIAALVRNRSLREAFSAQITEDMFVDDKHRVMSDVLRKAETSTDILEGANPIGGHAYVKYLNRLAKDFGKITPSEVTQWVKYLENDAKLRKVEGIVEGVQEELAQLDHTASSDKVIANFMGELVGTYETRTSKGFRTIDSVADTVIQDILDMSRGVVTNKTPTGFREFDEYLHGGLPNGLVTLGGLPGTGKTQLALQMLANNARDLLKKVRKSRGKFNPGVCCVVSAEMTYESLLTRMAQAYTKTQIIPNMPGDQVAKVIRFIERARSLPILVDDSDILTTSLIFRRLESAYAKYGAIREIMIDFAELIAEDDGADNKSQQVGKVFIRAKILSKRYNCPVILLSHLNRASEDSRTKVPSMRHLMHSRLAEAMSDIVLLLYNPYQFEITGKPVATPAGMPSIPDTSYIIIDKNRWGATGYKAMGWKGYITRWDDSSTAGMYHKIQANEVLSLLEEQ